MDGGKVWFPNSDIARGYTIISYLLHEKQHILEQWCNTLLEQSGKSFVPHGLQITA
jgi:hypothetical protein